MANTEALPTQYSDETANTLATELLRDATSDMTVAVVSAPSVFVALRNILVSKYISEQIP